MMGDAPLAGVIVLDFTQIEMGPCATQVLGDFGADVIKIERPGLGDPLRFYMAGPTGESAVFWGLNRNKRSVAIDAGIPIEMEGTPGSVRLPPPRLGEHSRQVLTDFGCTPEEIDLLTGTRPAQTRR
jgi:crotonobetainyl-CoA:carnitine CoA-transferase CaiB-like acyl-CoA transferase